MEKINLLNENNVRAFAIRPNARENFQIEVTLRHPLKNSSELKESSLSCGGSVSIPMSLVTSDYSTCLSRELSIRIQWMNRKLSKTIEDKYYLIDGERIELPDNISTNDFEIISKPENRLDKQFKKPVIEEIDISELIDNSKGLEIYNRKIQNTVFEYVINKEGIILYDLKYEEIIYRKDLDRKASLVGFYGFMCDKEQEGREALGLIFNWLVKNELVDHATMVCGRVGDGDSWRYLLYICSKGDPRVEDVNYKLGYKIQYNEGDKPRILDFKTLREKCLKSL